MVSQKGSNEGMMTQINYEFVAALSSVIIEQLKGGFLK